MSVMTSRNINQRMPMAAGGGYVYRDNLALGNLASPFGCCDFFDNCSDQIMSLHYGGQLDLLDWMGFNVSQDCVRTLDYIAYNRPAYSDGSPTPGYLANPCADPNSIEYGTARITVENFGMLGRSGPTRLIAKPERYCITRPQRRLDGVPVTSEREWDLRFAVDQLIQDMKRLVITGNATTPGQFDGLERWVRNGYPGPNGAMLNSTVVNWNGNSMAGGAGMTWNGQPLASTYNIVDVIKAFVRRTLQRKSWSPQLANQQLMLSDMIILIPTTGAQCLLDFFTCWSVCEGTEFNQVDLQRLEARTFRDGLVATSPNNAFGYGYITIDGVIIPILGYDWELIKGPKTMDMYVLTGAMGSVRLWEGEHISASTAVDYVGEGSGYSSIDGGRILLSSEVDNLCTVLKAWMFPRLFNTAPWAQMRIQNVQCEQPGGFLSPDPLESSFFPLDSSFSAAVC